MKKINTDNKIKTIIKALLFVTAITLIVQLFPSHSSFKYQFQIGKPWSYELITAPFNYPIYKDSKAIESEQKSALKYLSPYFKKDDKIANQEIKSFLNKSKNEPELPSAYKNYIVSKLRAVYSIGIINTEEFNRLSKKGNASINIIDKSQITRKSKLSQLLTSSSAYEYIIKNRPESLDIAILKNTNINFYLRENLIFDQKLTESDKADIINQISLTSGMVQAKERIIDRGEIVTDRTSVLLNSLKKELEKQKGVGPQNSFMWLGEIILVTSLMILLFLFLNLFRKNIYDNVKYIIFILLMMILMVAVSAITMKFTIDNIYIIPFAILPIIVRTFIDSRTALLVHIITVLQVALIVPDSYEFTLLQLTAGITAIASLKDLTQRSHLARAALLIFITYAVVYTGINLMIEGDITKLHYNNYIFFGINAVLLLFAYGLIYIFEKLFGFLSNVTLVELSNVNSSLMQEFAETAPGTFQHSLQVANLATEAAKTINGNALLVRIGALYHDIGKMANPLFFTENQLSGVNPLANLDFEIASKKIICHVEDGVKIAQKNNIPERIIDFITTHHGDSKTKYFYNSFKNKFPDVAINESAFKYTGPLPTTKEHAILMMADAVEATSRSLKEYSNESINNLVEMIVEKQIADGQFKNAKITFMDVEKVKTVFKEKLKTIYHTRVSYPELKK